MTWFKVDDGLHDHRKTRKVRRSHAKKKRDVAPFGIWALAGSWCGGNRTNGFIPLEVLEEWDDDAEALADRLVEAGLWRPDTVDDEPGYRFHDWDDRNPISATTEAEKSDPARFGNHLRWHVNRGIKNADCDFCEEVDSSGLSPDDRGDDRGDIAPIPESYRGGDSSRPDPTRPDPTDNTGDAAGKLTARSADADRDFDEWWTAYPRKVGKGQARKAYRAAAKKTDHATLIAAVVAQAPKLMTKGPEFCPYPATWLNGERWADDLAPVPTPAPDLPHVDDLPKPPNGLSDAEYVAWAHEQKRLREAGL